MLEAPTRPVIEWDADDALALRPFWMEQGNCRAHPTEMFFPSDGYGVMLAQAICATCPVKGRCLDFALEHREEHGVWGGTSERERKRLRRRRAVA